MYAFQAKYRRLPVLRLVLPLLSASSSADQGHVQSTFLTPRMSRVPRRAPGTDHYLHVYFSVVDLLSYRLNDPDDNVLQAFPL